MAQNPPAPTPFAFFAIFFVVKQHDNSLATIKSCNYSKHVFPLPSTQHKQINRWTIKQIKNKYYRWNNAHSIHRFFYNEQMKKMWLKRLLLISELLTMWHSFVWNKINFKIGLIFLKNVQQVHHILKINE